MAGFTFQAGHYNYATPMGLAFCWNLSGKGIFFHCAAQE